MKKYIKPFIIPSLYFTIMPLCLSLLNLIKICIPIYIYMILTSILLFISGYVLAKLVNKKILMHAVVYSGLLVFIFLLLSLITKATININTLLYYLILSLSTILGSMLYTLKKDK